MDPTHEFEGLLEELEKFAASVERHGSLPVDRGWTAAQHLQHIARALLLGGRAFRLLESVASGRSSDARVLQGEAALPTQEAVELLDAGVIEVGRAEAPDPVKPDPDVTVEEAVKAARRQLADWGKRRSAAEQCSHWSVAIPHPILGPLGADHWIRFNRIHVKHHRLIVERISDDR